MLEQERNEIIKKMIELQNRLEVINGLLEYSDYEDLVFYCA